MWLLLAFIGVPLAGNYAVHPSWRGHWAEMADVMLVVIVTAFLGTVFGALAGAQRDGEAAIVVFGFERPDGAVGPRGNDLVRGCAAADAGVFHRCRRLCADGAAVSHGGTFNYLRKRVNVQSFSMGGGMGVNMGGQRRPPA